MRSSPSSRPLAVKSVAAEHHVDAALFDELTGDFLLHPSFGDVRGERRRGRVGQFGGRHQPGRVAFVTSRFENGLDGDELAVLAVATDSSVVGLNTRCKGRRCGRGVGDDLLGVIGKRRDGAVGVVAVEAEGRFIRCDV